MRDYLAKNMPQFPKIGKIYDSPELAMQKENYMKEKTNRKKQSKKKMRLQESEESDDNELAAEIQKKVKKFNRIKTDEIEKLVDQASYYQE